MLTLTQSQIQRAVFILATFHILIIAASNYLVQLPIQVFGFHTTWGTFSFPFVYLATDLTVRIFGAAEARKIIFRAMLPALILSYLISVLFFEAVFQGVANLYTLNTFVLRIAFASFAAYTLGQLADVKIFSRLRQHVQWWLAPGASTIFGNLLDTLIFYSFAFWASSDPFMATHWIEIGTGDYCFKLIVSMVLLLPLYGIFLKYLTERILTTQPERQLTTP
ncbi:7-cyano-7-deazaguanine/7-aminomethyl-7-deazaguanine transporter [Desulfogranum marinum]|jgi:uncharacterized integral membrane protein (TIGR00697 family)|uniref:7-cyano-7-deazaguanine/7-aminomethyl-7- deazaguanine transporter n=1 Tax=Desulfogranum marinum TaxID=453220 RepID=UPI001963CCA1|nr:7-cyano-7-deazaguanine/7-aminomethyl-7-deazaguanine transporter [Desulfogranum marinum]MBM9514204.1 7-cyano-7-deazaguanine/7-aminomethyl-7-deazaguanine transporter [Desulfogranum marinum]